MRIIGFGSLQETFYTKAHPRRRTLINLVLAGVLTGAVLLSRSGAGGQVQRDRRLPGQGQVGQFDSYVLALSWAPAFCAQDAGNRSYRECDPHRHVGFVVHGLWPQRREGGTGTLEYCRNVHPASYAVVDNMLDIMPDRILVQHEWRAHGSCSGLSAHDYFALVKKAYTRLRIPRQFEARGRSLNTSASDVGRLFQTAGGLPDPAAVRVACRQGELTEVRICLSKNLDPIPCSNEARECRASSVTVRPVP